MSVGCRTRTFARWSRTLIVILAMINAGVNLGIFSPTLPEIEYLTSSTTAQVSTTFVWMGIASVVGSVLLGSLFDHCKDGMAVLAGAIFFQGISMGLAPYFRSLYAFQACAAIAAFFNYGIMAGCLAMNSRYWIDYPSLLGPVIQATILMHTVGTALTPQIIVPFLGGGHGGKCEKSTHNESAVTTEYTTTTSSTNISSIMTTFVSQIITTNDSTLVSSTTEAPGKSLLAPVQVAYIIVAIFDVLVSVVCLATYIIALDRWKRSRSAVNVRCTDTCTSDEEGEAPLLSENVPFGDEEISSAGVNDSTTSQRRLSVRPASPSSSPLRISHSSGVSASNGEVLQLSCRWRTLALLLVICLFFLVSGGRDAMLTGMLYTYTCEKLGWTVAWSARLVTVYHMTRVVVHVVIVFVSRYVSSRALTIFNLAVLILSSTVMLSTLYAQDGHFFTGASVVVMGLATSNINPTAITLADQSIHVTAKVVGIILAAIACGQIIVSPITGLILQSSHAIVGFPVILLALALAGAVVFAIWQTCTGQKCASRTEIIIPT